MEPIKDGDTVFVHYTGTLTDGSEFDSSKGRDPLEVVVGAGMLIKGFDRALPGMVVGEAKRIEVPCVDGYGPINPDNRMVVPRDQIPDDIPLELGLVLQMQGPEGHPIPVTVVDVGATEVTLDANHALAGKDLIFDLEIMSVKSS